MKIIFMGTPQFSTTILQAVHEEYGVDLVVTQPDRKVGRKRILTKNPVKQKAEELNIKVFQPRNIKKDYSPILTIKPNLIITAAYGQIIPNEVLEAPTLGCINVHGSLLPKLRGGAPIQRAIQRGHKKTGITIMYMAEKMDSGDIISQQAIPIEPTDTSGSLFQKLSKVAKELLMETLPSIINQTNSRRPQNTDKVTYAYNLKRKEEHLDWHQTTEAIDCHLRAFLPKPAVYTILDDKRLKIYNLRINDSIDFDQVKALENGEICFIDKDYFSVKCQDGVIDILEVQLAGKKRQDCKDFLNGAGRNLIQLSKVFK
ncbi:MAG: methionyl-tRNA formyltransferase [Candidatus Izimaplasma sp.]|nr:methionyl-tRNA formyltransferase [Candidatus Izimaplasma bacterium]